MDIVLHKHAVAQALASLETAIAHLVDALAHRPTQVVAEGAEDKRAALQRVCSAYATIDYGMEDSVGSSVVCLGVVGAPPEVFKRALAVNDAKARLKEVCVPLQNIRTRDSDLNLLAAYRRIPILDAPPLSVTYIRARTRAVYRKRIEDIYDMLAPIEGPAAASDRAKLETLGREEKFLAVARPHYENIRANILYAHLDRRGRGRMQIGAELPLMYAIGRHHAPPKVSFPEPVDESPARPLRARQPELEAAPFLNSMPAFRYIRTSDKKASQPPKVPKTL